MQVTAKLRYLRLAPRKVRQVADAIRGKKVAEAQTILQFLVRRPVLPISKLLKSAITSARNNFQLEENNLYISKITVDEGPKLKRWMPVSRGRTNPIFKRTSHITLILDEIKPSAKKKIKKAAQQQKESLVEQAKVEKTEETDKPFTNGELVKGKEADIIKRPTVHTQEERPKFEKRESKKLKGPGVIKRIFRRKAF